MGKVVMIYDGSCITGDISDRDSPVSGAHVYATEQP